MTTVTETWTDPVANYDLAAGQKVSEAIWDGVISDILYAARRTEVPLTNKSGGALSAGDVVVVDSANDSAVATTTTPGHIGPVGVARESISNNATGRIAFIGSASVKVTGTVTRGDFLEPSSVAGSAISVGAVKTPFSFARAMTASSGGYCTAVLLPGANGAGAVLLGSSRGTSISNSAAETTLLSISVPGNLLATLNGLRIRCWYQLANTVGSVQNHTFRLKYGGTTLFSMDPASGVGWANGLTDEGLFEADIFNDNAANVQRAIGRCSAAGQSQSYHNHQGGTAAIDSTAAQTLALTMQLGSASANLTFTEYKTLFEFIKGN